MREAPTWSAWSRYAARPAGLDPQDDLAEPVIDRRKQHGAGRRLLGGPGTPGLEVRRAQDALHWATDHHGKGALFHTTVAHFAAPGGLRQKVCVEGRECPKGRAGGSP